jgi:putative peptidoglycan lipid II flippase
VRIGIIALVANMFLNVLIVVPWYQSGAAGAHTGLAIATSLSAMLNAVLLYRELKRDGVLIHAPGWITLLLRVLFATVLMSAMYGSRPVSGRIASICFWPFSAVPRFISRVW